MAEFFKRGQVVPKRIGNIYVKSKARNKIRFGSDVWVEGNTISAVPNTGDCVLLLLAIGFKHKNGTFQRVDAKFKNLHFNCNGCDYAVKSYYPVELLNTPIE